MLSPTLEWEMGKFQEVRRYRKVGFCEVRRFQEVVRVFQVGRVNSSLLQLGIFLVLWS